MGHAVTLPFPLRSDITRATFHALEGEPALVPAIARRIEAALAALDPADAPALASRIGAAIHRPMMPVGTPSPLRRILFARRRARFARYREAIEQRRLDIAERYPPLAWVMVCDPDPAVGRRALAVLPDPPSAFHEALGEHLSRKESQ